MKKLTSLSVVIMLGAVGCGSDAGKPSDGITRDLAAPTSRNVSRFIADAHRIVYDYEPAESPSVLGSWADAVVTGTIVEVNDGQSYALKGSSEPESVTSVLEIKVDEVIAGDERFVADGHVYVEVEHPAFLGSTEGLTATEEDPDLDPNQEETQWEPFDLAGYAASVPKANGVFFLNDRTDESYYPVVFEEGAGRPSGASLMATFVQGFLIEDDNGQLMSVWEGFGAMPEPWHDLNSVEEVVSRI